MKCPNCRSEVSNQDVCPYCGATVYIKDVTSRHQDYSVRRIANSSGIWNVNVIATELRNINYKLHNLETKINIAMIFLCGIFVLLLLLIVMLTLK